MDNSYTGFCVAIIFVVLCFLFVSFGYSNGYNEARESFLDCPSVFSRHALDWHNKYRASEISPGVMEARKIAGDN